LYYGLVDFYYRIELDFCLSVSSCTISRSPLQ